MKKKSILSLLAVLGIFFLFSPGVSAHEEAGEDPHPHMEVVSVTGAEKNKLIADLLKSEAFKNFKKELKESEYHWNGVSGIEIDRLIEGNIEGNIVTNEDLIAIPVLTGDRKEKLYFLYAFGQFRGPIPKDF